MNSEKFLKNVKVLKIVEILVFIWRDEFEFRSVDFQICYCCDFEIFEEFANFSCQIEWRY